MSYISLLEAEILSLLYVTVKYKTDGGLCVGEVVGEVAEWVALHTGLVGETLACSPCAAVKYSAVQCRVM